MTGPPPRYYYTVYPNAPAPGRLSTSRVEITHILIAYAVLTLDLVLILGGSTILGQGVFSFSTYTIILAAVAALTGFLAHELAHKIAAQRRHSWAEFRMFPMGLVLSVFTAAIGFLFAAPGATVVGGMRDLKAWGETSIAGPLTNLAFGFGFLIGAYALGTSGNLGPWFAALVILGFFNGWFATFNLIPLGPLDGKKVLTWSPYAWLGAIVAGAGLTTLAYAVSYLGHPLLL